jgi:hypothetical protein
MGVELDHIFVCTSKGAPEAEQLLRFGLTEGPRNQHQGQGTSNRRFSFRNAMLELLWVSDEKQARSDQTRRTLLWERCCGLAANACPFGICLRPSDARANEPPFPSWAYRPSYLPASLAMYVAEAGLDEPMCIYLDFVTRAQREKNFATHPVGVREITGLVLTSPVPPRSSASQLVRDARILSVQAGPKFVLEVEFDGCKRGRVEDFQPHLPLIFKY